MEILMSISFVIINNINVQLLFGSVCDLDPRHQFCLLPSLLVYQTVAIEKVNPTVAHLRGLSDHCPLVLEANEENWGPRPTRMLKCWTEVPRYQQFVRNKLTLHIEGWGWFVLKEKLKRIKLALKEWHATHSQNLPSKIDLLKGRLSALEVKGEEEALSEAELEELHGITSDIHSLSRRSASISWQQSRSLWLKEGDANTKYFHSVSANCRRVNAISSIQVDGVTIEGVQPIRRAVVAHFASHFKATVVDRPGVDNLHYKSLGPDGVNFDFIKDFWPELQDDIMRFVTDFHRNGKLTKGLNSTFIALIPKVDSPQRLNDFRPISIVGSLYKILAKVLANRLRMVIGSVISESQTAFVKDRQILDGILIANEAVDEARRNKKELMLFKVDFEKAYDSVNWGYLDAVMGRMSFPVLWKKWIKECIRTASTSVLVNGNPTEEFPLERGLRQGDPLSPFLFLIAAEGLNVLMQALVEHQFSSGYSFGVQNQNSVSHLQFADDTLLLGTKSWANVRALRAALVLFETMSGLKVNFNKSMLVGVDIVDSWLSAAATTLRCKVGKISAENLLFDSEIERTARRNNSQRKKRKQLAKQKKQQEETSTSISSTHSIADETMAEPPPPTPEPCQNSPRRLAHLARPRAGARQTEMKTGYLQLLYANPFAGLPHEDPYNHLVKFYEIAGSLGATEAEEESVFQRGFPHSLIGKAKEWYLDQPTQVMTNWNTLEEKFLERFFPHHKFMEAKTSIAVFAQGANETLNEAWERYKSMLRKCPNHGFDELTQIHIFRNGLLQQTKLLLDATAGGSLLSLSAEDATTIIEKMALSDGHGDYNRNPSQRKPGILELDSSDAVLAQNKLLTNTVDQLSKQMSRMISLQEESSKAKQVAYCELCTGDHPTGHCPPTNEEVNFMGAQQRQGQYQNNAGYQRNNNATYGQGWRQDAGPSNRQRQYESFNQPPPQKNPTSSLEETMNKFMEMQIQQNQQQQKFQQETQVYQRGNDAVLRNLETQIGQIAREMSNNKNQGGSFAANTEPNPKEHCKSITTRSGKEIGKGIGDNLRTEEEVLKKKDDEVAEKSEKEVEEKNKQEVLVENTKKSKNEKNKKQECEGEVSEEREKSKNSEATMKNSPVQHLPYPHVPTKKDKDRQYARFLDIFKRLQINIPFSEALEQMPTYAKFMKEILTKKRRITDEETIHLDASCSAIIQRTLPTKEKDPGRVTLPVTIGNVNVGKALIDLGSSINLIPLSVIERIGGLDITRTRMTLQLADKSITRPSGIAEDVLVKVDKFMFPIDFVVMDIEEDDDVPLILGRSFMKTARMMIDIDDGVMKVRVQDEEVSFNLWEAMKHPKEKDECFKVDATEEAILDVRKQAHRPSSLEQALTDAFETLDPEKEEEIEDFLKQLDAFKELSPPETTTEELKVDEKPVEVNLELKTLPPHLKYAFLEDKDKKPVIISNSLSKGEEERLIQVLKDNKEAIGWALSDLKGISPSYCMHSIMMEDDYKPVAQPQRRLNPTMKEVVRKEVVKLLESGMIYPISDSAWVSPVQVVPKKGGMTVITNDKNELIPSRTVTGWRMCIDYRRLNKATRKDHFPLPFMDQMLERLAGQEFYCFLDGYSGYNQITVNPEDHEKTAFTCPFGVFAYRRMPFGLCNAPATFQRCMQAIFSDLIEKCIEVFMDDFSVFGPSFQHCLNNLDTVLKRCVETNLVLNWEKCHFMVTEGIVLGHKISSKGIEVDKAKIEVIEKLPPPVNVKGIRSFLGHAGFYRRFIKDFSRIAKPLSNLLNKDKSFNFDHECLLAFNELKERLLVQSLDKERTKFFMLYTMQAKC
ncbi:hypothetical protein TSUD_180480 [Trifolium subterraneum]|uniref:Reverse transcriptase domain-containing protein n=1 Tax=Trifolium subterraneum TaxID=3900 RepID=A0A2Z6NRP1_TRISU|nr:hypothetical protein TSUD_180480 [Trifolium subterraneum]